MTADFKRVSGGPARLAVRATKTLRLDEAWPLLTLALVAFLGWSFFAVAGLIREGDATSFDHAILLALRNPANLADPIGPSWIEESARDITGLGGHAILGLIVLAGTGYLLLSGRRRAAAFLVAAIGGGMLMSALLKIGYQRPRPDLVPHEVRVYTASFPSGHAMLSAITYLTSGALLSRLHAERRIKAYFIGVALFLTVIIGLSRIYLGVHWPTDVLAGWCVGAAWASLCWYVALVLQRSGQVEGERHDAIGQETIPG